MPSELDRVFDATLAAVIGPGGRIVIEHDAKGQAIVANFPATLPSFFATFCALNGAVEAVIAGDERLTFADLGRLSDEVARGLVARGMPEGRPGRDRDAQLPELDHHLYGRAEGGRDRDPAQWLVAGRGIAPRAGVDRTQADPGRRPARGAHRQGRG